MTTPKRAPLATDQRTRLVVGAMTGTSIDGLDVALASIEGRGLDMRVRMDRHAGVRFDDDLRDRLRAAAEQRPTTTGALARLALDLGKVHAEAIADLVADAGVGPIDLVVVHGQTVFHAPPVSWQLIQPAPIVARCGCPVLSDLRQADLADGGEGAPITPIADWILFRSALDRAVVNLGGFCNATLLPSGGGPDSVRGADLCACNQVLDAVARAALGRPFDPDGVHASRGRPNAEAASELRAILEAQRASRRSLGTGDEAFAWVERHRRTLPGDDLAATAADAVGRTIGGAVKDALAGCSAGGAAEILVAGGGARHRGLVAAIAEAAGCPARSLDSAGVPIDAREALAFAVLGALVADGVPITLPAVTKRGPSTVADGLWCLPAASDARD
jgi:1,6-anhydro-N-acetylmuramate kinase